MMMNSPEPKHITNLSMIHSKRLLAIFQHLDLNMRKLNIL